MKLAVNMSMRVVALVLECRVEGRIKHVTTRQVFFMTGQVDYLGGQGRGTKIYSSGCKFYCRFNKTITVYGLLLG